MKIMKLLSKNQTVGDGLGFFVVRDLYEDGGKRVSVRKTISINERETREMSVEELLEKFSLKKDNS